MMRIMLGLSEGPRSTIQNGRSLIPGAAVSRFVLIVRSCLSGAVLEEPIAFQQDTRAME